MAEINPRAAAHPWLEAELARQLGAAVAPADLWARIQEKRIRRSRLLHGWVLWPAVAAVLTLGIVELVWQAGRARGATIDMAQLSAPEIRELSDQSSGMVLASSDPGEIRAWVRRQGGIQIELPARCAPNVELIGAKVIPLRGTLVAAVAYRVNGRDATLLVSRKKFPLPPSKHRVSSIERASDERLFSWSMRDEIYAIAFHGAGDGRGACMLCHIHGL